MALNTYFTFSIKQYYGVDYGGPLPEQEEDETVVVPSIHHPLTGFQFYDLCSSINPLMYSSNFGIDIYLCVLDFVTLL